MRAVILAAGQGTRLQPLTDDRPKGMVAVAGKPIIQWQTELFRRCGINEIAIVKGYKADAVIDSVTRHFVNPEYRSSNMVYSLFCANEFLAGQVILSYGDILYSRQVLEAALGSNDPVSVVVDLDWEQYWTERFGNPFDDAESLIFDDTGAITSIGKPRPSPGEVQAQYIGLIKLTPEGIQAFRSIYADSWSSNRPIGWGRPWKQAYMTDLLQEVVRCGFRVAAVPIRRGWVEIDTIKDYEIATRALPGLMEA